VCTQNKFSLTPMSLLRLDVPLQLLGDSSRRENYQFPCTSQPFHI
jgi:hypothetical protein